MENEGVYPIAFLTNTNKFYFKHPTKISFDGSPRYIPNDNSDATYSLHCCIKDCKQPIWDKKEIKMYK